MGSYHNIILKFKELKDKKVILLPNIKIEIILKQTTHYEIERVMCGPNWGPSNTLRLKRQLVSHIKYINK